MTFQHHQSQLPQQRQVLCAGALGHAIVVLGKSYIQLPMQVVLNPPVIPQNLQIALGAHYFVADEIVRFYSRLLLANLALAHIHPDHTHSFPLVLTAYSLWINQDRTVTPLHSAVATVFRAVLIVLHTFEVCRQRPVNRLLDFLAQRRLIVLRDQDVVTATLDDLAGNGLLAAHGIDGD